MCTTIVRGILAHTHGMHHSIEIQHNDKLSFD